MVIEDELPVALDLKEMAEQVWKDIKVVGIVKSYREGMQWFAGNPMPDMILSDIELRDGLSFDLFREIPKLPPVIFCTAFNKYALQAFEANGIDYLLKPIEKERLVKSFEKLRQLRGFPDRGESDYQARFGAMLSQLESGKARSAIMVYRKDKIIPIKVADIAFIHTENTITYICTDTQRYATGRTLDSLVAELPPESFFRANRQFIVSRRVVLHIAQSEGRKLQVNLILTTPVPVLISKEKGTAFLKWMRAEP